MKAKADRLKDALYLIEGGNIISRRGSVCVVRSATKANRTYSVGIKNQVLFCSCADYQLHGRPCKHLLSCYAEPLVHLAFQLRNIATDEETIQYACSYYRDAINGLHPVFIRMAREEKEAARERLGMKIAA